MAEQAQSVQERLENYLLAEEAEANPEREEPKDAVREEPQEETAPEANAEAEVEEVEETEEEVEEVSITSFQELAEHLKISPEELYSLELNVTAADGTPKRVPLGEYKDSYQASDLLKAERERFGQERAVFEQEIAQKKQAMDQAFYTASRVLEETEKEIIGSIDSPELRELRAVDPGEYSARLAEHDKAVNALKARKESLAKEYRELMGRHQAETEAKQAQHLQQAVQALPKFIPEWADEKVASKEKADLISYGLSEGYTEQELNSLTDPRVVRSLRKAMLHDATQKAKPEVKKKVVSIGKKVIGGGKSKSKTERKADVVKQDLANFRKAGGRVQDAADLIEKHFLKD